MLKLLFRISMFYSPIRSQVFRSLFSMAEGGCEKFPDHWNPEFFWTIIVEYISHGCPVDILVKSWVIVRISLVSSPFELNDLTFNTFSFFFFRIFLSYESRKLALESELSINPNPPNSCGCAPSDGSFPRASDPTCEFVTRQEVFKFL